MAVLCGASMANVQRDRLDIVTRLDMMRRMQVLQEKLQTQRKARRKFASANPFAPKTIACFVE